MKFRLEERESDLGLAQHEHKSELMASLETRTGPIRCKVVPLLFVAVFGLDGESCTRCLPPSFCTVTESFKSQEADYQRRIRDVQATCEEKNSQVSSLNHQVVELTSDLDASARARRELEESLVHVCAVPGLSGFVEEP